VNPFFTVLSGAYILAIFFLADSSVADQISVFNPLSLLHIPLYGTLSLLLALALGNGQTYRPKLRYFIAALAASSVAILDEFHQAFLPTREASITDVFLDFGGIFLGLFIFQRLLSWRWTSYFIKHGKG
jgi:VanZ family protein